LWLRLEVGFSRLGGDGGAGAAESDRVRSDDAAGEIEALDEALAKLRVAELEDDSAVGALEAEVIERKDRLALTRRTRVDYEAQIQQRRAALAQVIADEAEEAYRLGLGERDSVARSLAEAAELFLARLAALDRAEAAAHGAWTTAQDRAREAGRRPQTAPPPELEATPEVLDEPWERLRAEIRDRANERFEKDLVEAAARSPMGYAIKDLPAHLRQIARERRMAIVRDPDHRKAAERSDE
jgi:hypothetical protein